MRRHLLVPVLAVVALLVGAACCGSECSNYLRFGAPVPGMTIAVGDTASYELFRTVWAVVNECDYDEEDARFPRVEVHVQDADVAQAALVQSRASLQDSRLLVRGRRPGRTRVVLRASATEDCDRVFDATHFTVRTVPSR